MEKKTQLKASLVITVYNEESTISLLLESILRQSVLPDEVIIVDGGSTDNTLSVISNIKYQISNKKIKIRVLTKMGNRSVGRNEGVKQAKAAIIALTDAGCFLHKDWIKNISEPFKDQAIDVVAGYYKGSPKTVFQKCLVPYVLIMEDKVDTKSFLPASRTMALRKSVWKKLNGFPEEYSNNEDYVFAKGLQKKKIKIVFRKDAIVEWMPRKNLKEAFFMFYRFAYGDAEAKIIRPKVILLFARYIVGIATILVAIFSHLSILFVTVGVLLFCYIFWSINKNYKYIKDWRAIFILPLLQITSDIAVLAGSMFGFRRLL